MDNGIDARVLVINEKNEILLVLEGGGPRTTPDGKTFTKPSMWGLPGGKSEAEDKDEIDTARRETEEETGIWVDINPRIKVKRQKEDYLKVGFVGYPVTGAIKIDGEEIIDRRWFPKKVLYDEDFKMYRIHRQMAQELFERLASKKEEAESGKWG